MEIDKMLDLVFELEGLLLLRKNRADAPERVDSLIQEKICALSAFSSPEAAAVEMPYSPVAGETAASDEVADTSEVEAAPLEVDEDEEILSKEPAPGPAAGGEENGEAEDFDCSYVIEDDDEDGAEAPVQSAPAKAPLPENASPRVQAPVFSVNDRFYFARELFGGSLQSLDNALRDAASLDSFEEAEDYFYSQRGLDPENTVAQDFLSIVGKLYN